ncbi:MAG: STAS domain-containing protein [Chitinispirillaceae bacterium]|nr:STAS domain-containing protein [Chitinispirillaceae bacterium]
MGEIAKDELEVTVKKEDSLPIVELRGRIADLDVKRVQNKIEQLYKKKVQKIIIDVSAASFLDSHGLGTIVYYHTLMQKEGRQLLILNANTDQSAYINRLFELTNLDKVLNIVSQL